MRHLSPSLDLGKPPCAPTAMLREVPPAVGISLPMRLLHAFGVFASLGQSPYTPMVHAHQFSVFVEN